MNVEVEQNIPKNLWEELNKIRLEREAILDGMDEKGINPWNPKDLPNTTHFMVRHMMDHPEEIISFVAYYLETQNKERESWRHMTTQNILNLYYDYMYKSWIDDDRLEAMIKDFETLWDPK